MMMSDDLIYVGLLLGSIAFGRVTRHSALLHHPRVRKTISTMGGVLIILTVSGFHAFHPIFGVTMQVFLLKAVPVKLVHLVSFVAGFSHLFFLRLCGSGILSSFPAIPSHTNAIQMILTLKMMGLAFEVHDSKYEVTDELEQKYRAVEPSVVDTFHYGLSHVGVLTGPYYKFRTFQDMYDSPWSSQADCDSAMWRRVANVPIYVFLFLLADCVFPLEVVKQDDFYQNSSFIYRVFYMTPVFFAFRMRLYSGFVLAECGCIMAGLGAYPTASKPKSGNGPTDLQELRKMEKMKKCNLEIDFETVHNIFEYKTETVSTMRESMKAWNMTVQYWLAVNVYRRLPRFSRSFKAMAVMVTSSAWHGVYPGYYLAMASVPFMLPVEDLYESILRRRFVEGNSSGWTKAYDWLAWFVRFQWFSYLGMAFLLLHIEPTLKLWDSVYYAAHLSLPLFYVLGLFVVKPLVKMILPAKSGV